jgi:hypothetical protein
VGGRAPAAKDNLRRHLLLGVPSGALSARLLVSSLLARARSRALAVPPPLSNHLPFQHMLEGTKAPEIRMGYQVAEEMSPPLPPATDALEDKERVHSGAPNQTDATSIIQRVSGLTIGELDKTIQELQKVRGFLLSEEERMRREMADYLKLTQAAISSTKAMAESIAHFGSLLTDNGKKVNS